MPFYHYESIPKIQSDVFDIIDQLGAHFPHVDPIIATKQSRSGNPISLTHDFLSFHARILFSTISAWNDDQVPVDYAYRTALDHCSLVENAVAIANALLFYAARAIPETEVNLHISASETLLHSLKRKIRTVFGYIYAARYIAQKEETP
jgi:hypothetical protein